MELEVGEYSPTDSLPQGETLNTLVLSTVGGGTSVYSLRGRAFLVERRRRNARHATHNAATAPIAAAAD